MPKVPLPALFSMPYNSVTTHFRDAMADDLNLNQQLFAAAADGDSQGIVRLLALGADALYWECLALREAAEHGHAECVKLLIPISNPKADNSSALARAAKHGHAECVELLIPVSNPNANNSGALGWAVHNGHAECVKLLIPVSDPKHDNSLALRVAAGQGYLECVKLLIPISDPKDDNSAALATAAEHGHTECVKILLPVSDPKADSSYALRLAALHGHAECVELLRFASDPKANDSLALRNAIANGRAGCALLLVPVSDPLIGMVEDVARIASTFDESANVLPTLLALEPRLFDELNFPAILAAATAKGHAKMALLISSIIEQKSLAAHLPSLAASNAPSPRRI